MIERLPAQEELLHRLVDVFLAENAKVNLSAHRTKEKVWEGNVMDSLAGIQCLQQFSILNFQFSILDLGTGGGFPLLPLAIMFPQHRFTGLDSVRKKMDAVERIVSSMNLSNVMLLTGRAEELGRNHAHREQYDIVTVRAVAETAILLEYCAPFVKVGGKILLWKSMDIDEEISSASGAEAKLHLQRKSPIIYELGNDWGQRQILIYEKIKATPKEYPRSVGSAKKHPL
ncbi:16S rRNA (guanine(527)-N(7))-methyltransferase RsmG [Candidatus Peribacteria bacterium RIFCSPHIGHO2_01_FULL_55_13]|nr:MAG: 16S rRNA (guanine(527)-N(7))-methyltransferase RsmG [Candidatus Peribacteria bacterium RIFCSPHIGHO2_01_FULL_55_13]OGJ64739.1 MAG: 16S rRNA (guanine(527)-N(7))-methyltransferase RsmG [Candidatus Peribacteria bacterium RIFCSPHIGHO2_12_FULL_55_11]